MTKIHDSGYKKLLSNKTIFRQLLQTFVKEPWVDDLDFNDCETLDKSFVSDHYKATESDIIYKIKLNNQDIYIFILIEFQSTVYRFMVVRILNYITSFYLDYLSSHDRVKKLPPIFPILLYNGDDSWTAPQNISDLIEDNELLGEYGLNFKYFKIAENEYTLETLTAVRNIVSTLFLAEAHYDIELIKKELLAVFQKEEDKQAASLFLNWFKQLSERQRIETKDYDQLEQVYKNVEEVDAMLITALKKEREQLYNTGMEVGHQEGRQEGRQETTLEVIIAMWRDNLSAERIARITGLNIKRVKDIAEQEAFNSNTNALQV
jgi:predicted transposase/invertase (TIGR01784 family)